MNGVVAREFERHILLTVDGPGASEKCRSKMAVPALPRGSFWRQFPFKEVPRFAHVRAPQVGLLAEDLGIARLFVLELFKRPLDAVEKRVSSRGFIRVFLAKIRVQRSQALHPEAAGRHRGFRAENEVCKSEKRKAKVRTRHRGNTYSYRAVTSILSQRLLHEMANPSLLFLKG